MNDVKTTPENPAKSPKKTLRLGEYLVMIGLIDKETLNKALKAQKSSKKKLGEVLMDMGVADDVVIAKALAVRLKLPYGRINNADIPNDIIALIPPELAEKHAVIPLRMNGNRLLVAMANPLDLYALEDLRFYTQLPIDRAVVPSSDIAATIEKYYPQPDLKMNLGLEFGAEDDDIEVVEKKKEKETPIRELQDLGDLPPIVKFVNSVISDAIKLKASDIHIEPQEKSLVVRYRVDGIMREIMRADRNIHPAVASRIKIMSDLDIAIKRKPQDGKAQVKQGGKIFDLRVSSLPTSYGEKVTIRILNPATAQLNPEDLGFSDKALKTLNRAIQMPQGIILVTGPTGSGKSSTLYACLNKLNSPEVNIITVEDPVEFDVAGINQVQINPSAGITFAKGLRSILRQDPDIVMVGEIRDKETAVTAFQAAQTGHLVFSTLHTNDAPSAVVRLMDLDIDPFLVSASLIAVIGQRLVRKICESCKAPDNLPPEQLEEIRPYIGNKKDVVFWKGKGCETCQHTGYSGRLGLFEMLTLTSSLKEVISSGLSSEKLKKAAQKEGFRVMSFDGIQKALQGLTTIDEVFRVAPPEIVTDSHTATMDSPAQEALTSKKEDTCSLTTDCPIKILVVDDNLVVLKLLRHLLESEDYLVITAENGVEAFKLASAENPDIIVTDYEMPEMDGVMLIKKLKNQTCTRSIPVMMLTARDEEESELEGLDAGADDYLTKPIARKRFLARVALLLKRKK
ncbi:MAG: Flp pilus assembly complex ATPase component [Deltaproteobacteria bacterium]|nr:Flp pilus assembly complex ATPase component [Deltaproteobacteria bacterium]